MLQTQEEFDATLYAWAIPKALSELGKKTQLFVSVIT